MKVLVTGANGLLGQKLVPLLVEKGLEVVATGRGENRNPSSGFKYRSLDVTNEAEVMTALKAEQPEAIIHTAAMTNVDQCESDRENCWKQNVNAVQYLARAASALGAFLLHISTDFIFDGEAGPYDEKAEPNPISYYGESKLASEKILMESNIDWAIARTVLVYGIVADMSRSNIILWVKKSLEERKEIKVVNDQLRSPTLAEDLAMGCYLIVAKKAKGVFNISGKDLLTPFNMATMTAQYFGLQTETMQQADGSIFQQPAKRPPKTGLLIDKAREEIGYEPHSFEEGIAIVSDQVKKAESNS